MALSRADINTQLLHIRDDRQRESIVTSMVLASLATIAVITRMWSRKLMGVSWMADDYLIVVALVFAWGAAACVFPAIHHGYGKHTVAAGLIKVINFLKVEFAFEILYNMCILFIKASILFFYSRIFPGRNFRLALHGVFTFVVLWWTTNMVMTCVQCTPTRFIWQKTLADGHCVNLTKLLVALAALNIVTDVAILILPMHAVWHLQVPKAQRAAVSCIFLLGGFVCIASIVRVWYLSRLVTTDSTWTTVDPTNWSTIEICLGIVSACLPIMRPLLRHALNVRVSVHIGSRQSTKLREISNSHGSKNGGSGHHAASAGRNLNIASPGNGMVPLSSHTSNTADWPGYSQHHSGYKTTLDRDLVSQSHAQDGSNEPRLPSKSASRGGWSTYNGPFNPAHSKNRSEETGLTTEITLGDSSGRGSATSDADDLINRIEEKPTKGFRRGPSKAKSLSERDIEQATLALPRRGGIKVEKVMEWSEEKRGLPS